MLIVIRRSTMSHTRKSLLVSLLLPAAMLIGVSVAQAQQTQPQQWMMGQGMMGGPGSPGMMGQGMMGGPGMMGRGMMSGPMVQGHLAYLKAELGITEAQSA